MEPNPCLAALSQLRSQLRATAGGEVSVSHQSLLGTREPWAEKHHSSPGLCRVRNQTRELQPSSVPPHCSLQLPSAPHCSQPHRLWMFPPPGIPTRCWLGHSYGEEGRELSPSQVPRVPGRVLGRIPQFQPHRVTSPVTLGISQPGLSSSQNHEIIRDSFCHQNPPLERVGNFPALPLAP